MAAREPEIESVHSGDPLELCAIDVGGARAPSPSKVSEILLTIEGFQDLVEKLERDVRQPAVRELVEPLLGTTFPIGESTYLLQSFLGSGAEGIVFRAIDTRRDEPVALKLSSLFSLNEGEEFWVHSFDKGTAGDCFQREVRALRQLQRFNVPNVQQFVRAATLRDPESDKNCGILVTRIAPGEPLSVIEDRAIRGDLPLGIMASAYGRIAPALVKIAACGLSLDEVSIDNMVANVSASNKLTGLTILDFATAIFYPPNQIELAHQDILNEFYIRGMASERFPELDRGRRPIIESFFEAMREIRHDLVSGQISMRQYQNRLRNIASLR